MNNVLLKILIFGLIFAVVVAFIIFAVALFSSSALKQDSSKEQAETPITTETPVTTLEQIVVNQPITITKILSTPVVYKDLNVSVDGQVVGWITKNAILVSEVGEKDRKKYLLVIRDQNFGLPAEVPGNDVALGETVRVSISGTAGILNISEGATGYGDEASVAQLQKWNKKPVIFASSVVQK